MPSTIPLETDLRFASRIENWQRLILLSVAGSSQIDAHLCHAIVCHAENASIRTALIEACLDPAGTRPDRGGGDAEEMPFSVGRLLSMGRTAPVPLVLEVARLRRAFYRRLRMMARRAQDRRAMRVCDEIYRQEGEFMQGFRARHASATPPVWTARNPRAASPFDAVLARHAARASASWPELPTTQ